ncbi:MAG TPA: amidohydrolase family protein [Longimicrobiales bacterium]|nr:amidohydrolase family protein [Longimicrobiales bacterium]
MPRSLVLLCVALMATAVPARAQLAPDSALAAAISRIKAVDNHSHVVAVVRPGERPDTEYDALPVDGMEPFALPARMSAENPEFVGAWRELWGYRWTDMSAAHVAEVAAARARVRRERGDDYPAWVLDRLGIETMIGNRIAMGRGLAAPRFRWASYADALLFPVGTESLRSRNNDARAFFANEEKLLRRYLAESGVAALPPTLDEYLGRVVTPTLERQRRGGVLALKFEAAYLRGLDFEPAPAEEATRIYARYVAGGEPSVAEDKLLSDYIFRQIAREAGRLGLALHFHTGAGAGAYFDLRGSSPANLESAVDDPALRATKFVLVHGGWPFTKETALLLGKPNVYADFSYQSFMLPPRQLAEVLRTWLELYPEKVLFATDAFEIGGQVGWEEVAWLTTTSARRALALALTGMMRDGEVTRARALEIARLVLHDNAAKLYGLGPVTVGTAPTP